MLVPTSQAGSFIAGTLAALDPADVGQGPILVYPYLGNRFTAPNFRVPSGETFFLFGLLRTAVPPTAERSAGAGRREPPALRAGARGKRLLLPHRLRADEPRGLAPPLRRPLAQFHAAKQEFDPDALLAPGQGIFLEG